MDKEQRSFMMRDFAGLVEDYVPNKGLADTRGGEILRAVQEILEDYYFLMRRVGAPYGCNKNPCDVAYAMLKNNYGFGVPTVWWSMSDEEYLKALDNLVRWALDKVSDPEYFNCENDLEMGSEYRNYFE